MRVTARALVRRWGGRAVGLAITGVVLYIVTPSLLSLFGAWPRLAEVQPRWFLLLVLLEAGSLASLWWLTRLALQPHQGFLPHCCALSRTAHPSQTSLSKRLVNTRTSKGSLFFASKTTGTPVPAPALARGAPRVMLRGEGRDFPGR